jgi:hypothetical protein
MATYLVKSGHHYVKSVGGRPSSRSTPNLADAARFATEAEAREWAPNVFAKSMLAAVEIVAETPGRSVRSTGSGWGRPTFEQEDEIIHGVN